MPSSMVWTPSVISKVTTYYVHCTQTQEVLSSFVNISYFGKHLKSIDAFTRVRELNTVHLWDSQLKIPDLRSYEGLHKPAVLVVLTFGS